MRLPRFGGASMLDFEIGGGSGKFFDGSGACPETAVSERAAASASISEKTASTGKCCSALGAGAGEACGIGAGRGSATGSNAGPERWKTRAGIGTGAAGAACVRCAVGIRNASGGKGRGGAMSNTSVPSRAPTLADASAAGAISLSSADVSAGGAAVRSDVSSDRSMLCLF